ARNDRRKVNLVAEISIHGVQASWTARRVVGLWRHLEREGQTLRLFGVGRGGVVVRRHRAGGVEGDLEPGDAGKGDDTQRGSGGPLGHGSSRSDGSFGVG